MNSLCFYVIALKNGDKALTNLMLQLLVDAKRNWRIYEAAL